MGTQGVTVSVVIDTEVNNNQLVAEEIKEFRIPCVILIIYAKLTS